MWSSSRLPLDEITTQALEVMEGEGGAQSGRVKEAIRVERSMKDLCEVNVEVTKQEHKDRIT